MRVRTPKRYLLPYLNFLKKKIWCRDFLDFSIMSTKLVWINYRTTFLGGLSDYRLSDVQFGKLSGVVLVTQTIGLSNIGLQNNYRLPSSASSTYRYWFSWSVLHAFQIRLDGFFQVFQRVTCEWLSISLHDVWMTYCFSAWRATPRARCRPSRPVSRPSPGNDPPSGPSNRPALTVRQLLEFMPLFYLLLFHPLYLFCFQRKLSMTQQDILLFY